MFKNQRIPNESYKNTHTQIMLYSYNIEIDWLISSTTNNLHIVQVVTSTKLDFLFFHRFTRDRVVGVVVG